VLAPELIGDGLDPRALLCNLLANQPGLPNALANAPASDALTQVARASVVCGAILGNGTGAGTPLGLSLAPVQNLLNLLNAQPTQAIKPLVTGLPGAAALAPQTPATQQETTPQQPGAGILGFTTAPNGGS
jgi:hypothetical protein